ncbi:hypothetical protein D1AOALGA4SA_9536 [Olavius algarvensis Delta 1 endosymbiont]|nr:hypothetical protein D1AOALGA4SA_9536 [Olavius algarvensis Delta 1 endosymbiont]
MVIGYLFERNQFDFLMVTFLSGHCIHLLKSDHVFATFML